MSDEILRRFARDQWVRVHGTPRVTVLVGAGQARRMWQQWLEVGDLQGELYEGEQTTMLHPASEQETLMQHDLHAPPPTQVVMELPPGGLADGLETRMAVRGPRATSGTTWCTRSRRPLPGACAPWRST